MAQTAKMKIHDRAVDSLAPFLALAKSATSPRAATELVTQATSAANTYVFTELIHTKCMQDLSLDSQYSSHYRLLEIFAWGTWQDYQENQESLPTLSTAQTHKLRLLSLLTEASRSKTGLELAYADLQQSLSLDSAQELEALITESIYSELMHGTLDPTHGVVLVNSVAPIRDLPPGGVNSMIQELDIWSQRCDQVLADLEANMASVKRTAQTRQVHEIELAAQAKGAEQRWAVTLGSEQGAAEVQLRTQGTDAATRDSGDAMDLDKQSTPSGRKNKANQSAGRR